MGKPQLGVKKTNSGKQFYSVANGKFVRRVQEEIQDVTVPREITKGEKAGSIVHEIHEDAFVAELKKVEVTTKDLKAAGKVDFLVLTLDISNEEEPELICIEMHLDSNYAFSFLDRMPNLSVPCYVELSPYDFTADGKRRTGMTVKGYDAKSETFKKLDSFYTKANPKDKPEWKKVVVSGKDHWDKTEVLKFFKTNIWKFDAALQGDVFKSKDQGAKPANEIVNTEANEPEVFDPESDDLPF